MKIINLEEILPRLKAYRVGDVVTKVTCSEKYVLEGTGKESSTSGFRSEKEYRQIFKSTRL